MKQSQLYFSTLREAPADAEVVSHQLMLRAGLIKQLAAGIYSYMPLGLRVLKRIEQVIREEMDLAGAQEILMPVMQPAELWKESGRYDVYGPELIRLADRQQREFALGPTHEEVITSIVRQDINSYRKLPVTLYQIQTKFRDERRPRFGLLRTREFVMKDAYSFDTDWEGLDTTYHRMYEAYNRIFTRLGLNYRAVEADAGAIGGEGGTHEFIALADIGEDTIAHCDQCQYAANIEQASAKVNPSDFVEVIAHSQTRFNDAPLEKLYTPGMSTIEQLVQNLRVDAKQIIKTMLFIVDGQPVAVVVRGDYEVNELKVKNYLRALTINLANDHEVAAHISSVTGYVGPIGLTVPVLVDYSVLELTDGILGANEQDYHYKHVNVRRDLDVTHVSDFRNVVEGDTCPRCEAGRLQFNRGIELGHIFKLGTKYSESMSATFLDKAGKSQHFVMGCYGIGISRILSALIEQQVEGDGIVWPTIISPYQLHIIPISYADENQRELAERMATPLEQAGINVLIDDRDERAGVKFKDADLIGIPYRIIVGKDAASGKVEWIDRINNTKDLLDASAVVERISTIYSGSKTI
ncbi:proline--tRNA ligase [Paenibacillus camelliae]|uniref:proline--tRNA ligase n=1 Tax=Paenibacillus camelliae TaxID=512410 RepID=UPI00203B895E|nr:proline--tRNA ligase [Paenibacillus camelliae]MCM3631811.1 proline--tRNA ligase [Paenibacillus camelliae]